MPAKPDLLEEIYKKYSSARDLLQQGYSTFEDVFGSSVTLSHFQVLAIFGFSAISFIAFHRGFKRIRKVNQLKNRMFGKRLSGVAVHVNDSDNIRFYHTPLLRFWFPSITREKYKHETLNVRLAGIDAPECAHFGNPAQPFSAEAKAWLTKTIAKKRVSIIPHRVDQYGRLVATIYYRKWFFSRNLSVDMVRAGFACVYDSAGAEYNGDLKVLQYYEARAKRKRIGMWSKGKPTTPKEYKENIRKK